MGLLHGVELDVRVQQQPVEQVSGATLRLADDVKRGQAAEAEEAAVPPEQVLLEAALQAHVDGLEALGAHSEVVVPVGVAAEVTGEPLVPARAPDAGQEVARNRRGQLQGDRERFRKQKETLRNTV